MIEALIYAVGSAAILAALMVIIVWCIYALAFSLVKKTYLKLSSLYRHTQLFFFMKELKAKGYAQCVDEIGKSDPLDS